MMYHHNPSEDSLRISNEDHRFTDLHVCVWVGKHCEEWASQVCRKRGVDLVKVDLRGFRVTNGISLQNFSRQDFCSLVGDQYGAMFYKELRSYRAIMQKHRCSRCVGSEETLTMTSLAESIGMQDTASDLSSRSQRNSPDPHHVYQQEYVTSYPDQMSPLPYEGRARYSGEQSPSRSCEGSLSPVYQERIMSPEVYSHQQLPHTPDSYRSHSQSPQSIYTDQVYRRIQDDQEVFHRIRKPLPELLPIESEDEDLEPPQENLMVGPYRTEGISRGPFEHPQSNRPLQIIYTTHPSLASHPATHHPEYIVHPSSHHPNQLDEPHHHTRIIRYATAHPSRHPAHYNRPSPGSHPNPPPYVSHPSVKVYESDEDGDESPEESGRLVIDLMEDNKDDLGITGMENGLGRLPREFGSVPHLQKIPTKRKRDRGPKSWEFLMRLLACPKTNPSIIRWEDEAEGSFRLVQPQEIANMWGTRSNKEELTYNNFARALRYHYKTKLLYKISERQLVYGCGPAAMDFYRRLVNEGSKSPLGGTG